MHEFSLCTFWQTMRTSNIFMWPIFNRFRYWFGQKDLCFIPARFRTHHNFNVKIISLERKRERKRDTEDQFVVFEKIYTFTRLKAREIFWNNETKQLIYNSILGWIVYQSMKNINSSLIWKCLPLIFIWNSSEKQILD